MRKIENSQMEFGEDAIGEIDIDAKSRDDIPALLRGIQHIYTNRQIREKIFSLLQEQVRPGINLKVGRPGMDLWRVFVLAVVKQGLGCDYDRLQELANQHQTVRKMLGHSEGFYKDKSSYYQLQTLIDNVSLLRAQLLSEIGKIVVESGHGGGEKKVISMFLKKTELSIRLVSREAISSYGGSRGCGLAVALRSACQFSK